MLRELILLWEQGIIAARPKKAAAVKAKFETARKLTGMWRDGMSALTTNQAGLEGTLDLLSISGMKKSIRKGLKTPVQKCAKKLKW
jgi:hypothetical protein